MPVTDPDGPSARILVASHCSSAGSLEQEITRHGYVADVATSGAAVLAAHREFDLVLLDTDLPDLDGVSVCQRIRRDSDIPIIAFTSASAEVDRVLLLEMGCDDCVERPYRPRELVARIKAVLRRTGPRRTAAELSRGGAGDDQLRYGPLLIEPVRREASLNGRSLTLTRKEFDLLHTLAAEPERVFERQELMSAVWDYPSDNRISAQASRTIDTHVSSLRGKLGDSDWITTIRGIGFRFGMCASAVDVDVDVAVGAGRDAAVGTGTEALAAAQPEGVTERVYPRPRLVSTQTASESQ
ncbi:response regulator transcription factor [Streptomyces sp. JJ66]|uniref:response regulator transcription factor n=1 Tax=Streptomyces sp. JJ66 TaxID=2803843 RepID=UPI001C59D2DF|nr:response regulator transcription factor [Streptomyces sp. JJ66]MBW1600593.1 response regulator transcription factor [Streptomyces sp. JJ66]